MVDEEEKEGLQPFLGMEEEEFAERFGLILDPSEEVRWIQSFLRECRVDRIPGTNLAIGNVCAVEKARKQGMKIISLTDWPEWDWSKRRVRKLVRRIDKLVKKGKDVYMHCFAGVDRCPTAAVAYLVAQCEDPIRAVGRVVKARPEADPHVSWILDFIFDQIERKEVEGCPTK